MTRSLALEWGFYGIWVSGIAAGWIGNTTGTACDAIFKHLSSLASQSVLASLLQDCPTLVSDNTKAALHLPLH